VQQHILGVVGNVTLL